MDHATIGKRLIEASDRSGRVGRYALEYHVRKTGVFVHASYDNVRIARIVSWRQLSDAIHDPLLAVEHEMFGLLCANTGEPSPLID